MKKLLFVLMALLITAPVMAVSLTTSVSGNNVTVGYTANGTTAATRVAGFGLLVTADNGAKITACTVAKTGVSTAASKGYGITIPTMTFDGSGNPTAYGNGVEPTRAALPSGIGTSQIVVSLGALYAPHANGDVNAPGASGNLFTITVDGGCTVSITEEETMVGGVVFENGTATGSTVSGVLIPNLSATATVVGDTCIPSSAPSYAQWVLVGKPNSWCGYRQCYGDADNAQEPYGKGYVWVGQNDLNVLVSGWRKTGTVPYPAWIAADFSRTQEAYGKGYVRVGQVDLNTLVANWRKTTVASDCRTK